jgi:hypothetical protein
MADRTTPTRYPGIRIAHHGARNWRTEYHDGAGWDVTGPAYATKAEALEQVDEVRRVCFEVWS